MRVVVALAGAGLIALMLSEFFVTYLTTALGSDDLLSEIYFPALPPGTGWSCPRTRRRR